MSRFNNLAEKAAAAEKRREEVRRETIFKYAVLPVILLLALAAPILMFINNASYSPSLFLLGQIAVIVEVILAVLAVFGAWYISKNERKWEHPTALAAILWGLFLLFLVLAIFGFESDTFQKGRWRRSEDGVFFVQVGGGVHVVGIDSSATDVTIKTEYDYFPVTGIELSIGGKSALQNLVINLETIAAKDVKLKLRNVEGLRNLSFVGGEFNLGSVKNCSLQTVSFENCIVYIPTKGILKSHIVSLNLKNSTANFTIDSLKKSGITDLNAEGSTISAYRADLKNKYPIALAASLNRVFLKDSSMKDIHTNIGTLVLDGVCKVELDRSYCLKPGNRYYADLSVRSLVLKEGFNGAESHVVYTANQYRLIDNSVTSTTYHPVGQHIYVAEGVANLPAGLFGDEFTASAGSLTIHYGGGEEAFKGVAKSGTNNALLASAIILYNETSEYWN